MAAIQAFDTLAYAKTLMARDFEKEQAEALAATNREFFTNDPATKEFVRSAIR